MSRPDRTRPPAPSARKPCPFPDFVDQTLDNGLRLLCLPSTAFPIISAEMLFHSGGHHNPTDRPGLSKLHATLLTEGSDRHTGPELARAIEALGGSLTSGAGWNLGSVELNVLAANADAGFDLLAETTRDASFPEDQVERVRDVQLASLLRRRTSPRSMAEDAFNSVVYPGTPYLHPMDGRRDAVETYDRDTVLEFHNRHVVPENACLIALGDLDPAWLRDRAEQLWGDWQPRVGEPIVEPIFDVPTRSAPRVVIVDRPGAAQTAFQLGHVGPPRRHPDFHAIMVLNVLLGGKFTSRLNLNLRERHGFTYGVQSQFSRRRGPGPFHVKAAVATDVAGAAIRETLFEIDRLRQEAATDDEVRETQDYMLGVFAYTLQTLQDIGNRLEALVSYDLPADYYDTYPGVLADITAADILDVAQRHIRPEEFAIVACGPAEALQPQLEPFGEVEVVRA